MKIVHRKESRALETTKVVMQNSTFIVIHVDTKSRKSWNKHRTSFKETSLLTA